MCQHTEVRMLSEKYPTANRSSTFDQARCPFLPQEILDKIIYFSIYLDPVLGPLPEEVDQAFQSPFLHVNQACRQRVLSVISSSTWIEVKSVKLELNDDDDSDEDLVGEIMNSFAVVPQVWVTNFLRTGNVSQIVIEFDPRIARGREARDENATRSFFIPYSYSSMLSMLYHIDIFFNFLDIGTVSLRSERLYKPHLRDVQLLLSLRLAEDVPWLDTELNQSLKRLSVDNRDVQVRPLLIIARMRFMNSKLHEQATTVSRLQYMLLYLHMNKQLNMFIKYMIPGPNPPEPYWAETLERSDWRTADCDARTYLQIMWSLYKLEAAAFRFFWELLRTNRAWTLWQIEHLTNGYSRWVWEHRIDWCGWGLPDNDMSNLLHNSAVATEFYRDIWFGREPQPVDTRTVTEAYWRNPWRLRDRLALIQCASYLKPEDKTLEKQLTDARDYLSETFPDLYDQREHDHFEWSYTDLDGNECTHLHTPVTEWYHGHLKFLPRAQQITKDLQGQTEYCNLMYLDS